MASGSGKPLFQLTRDQVPDDAFTRCPKTPKFDFVQVRSHCLGCEHCMGFVMDESSAPVTFGTVCAHPIGRWWKTIVIHRPGK